MKPLRKKLQKCRDPDRADLVALQQARREQASRKDKTAGGGGAAGGDDAAVFGGEGVRDAKRRKMGGDDMFGGAL